METQEVTQIERPYEPTAEQAERAAELRRFNRLFVYGPIGLISAIVVTLIVLLLIVAINPPSGEALLFISGLADVALVIAILPIVIVGAALLGLIGYAYITARKNGTAPIRQTQRLLWRMDNVVGRLRVRTERAAEGVIQPFLSMNGAVAYVKTLIMQIMRMVKRS